MIMIGNSYITVAMDVSQPLLTYIMLCINKYLQVGAMLRNFLINHFHLVHLDCVMHLLLMHTLLHVIADGQEVYHEVQSLRGGVQQRGDFASTLFQPKFSVRENLNVLVVIVDAPTDLLDCRSRSESVNSEGEGWLSSSSLHDPQRKHHI